MGKIINFEKASKELLMGKNKKKKWAEKGTKMVSAKKKLTAGLLNVIAFMRIIDETMTRMKDTKQLSREVESELMTGLRFGRKILEEFFAMPKPEISRIWDSLDSKWITEKAMELYRDLTKKIIMSDEPAFHRGVKDLKVKFDETLK